MQRVRMGSQSEKSERIPAGQAEVAPGGACARPCPIPLAQAVAGRGGSADRRLLPTTNAVPQAPPQPAKQATPAILPRSHSTARGRRGPEVTAGEWRRQAGAVCPGQPRSRSLLRLQIVASTPRGQPASTRATIARRVDSCQDTRHRATGPPGLSGLTPASGLCYRGT